MCYKIKYRSSKYDNLSTGWYIYSRHPFPSRLKNGRPGFRKYLMAGPFSSRGDALTHAGLLRLKFDEFAKKIQKRNKQND